MKLSRSHLINTFGVRQINGLRRGKPIYEMTSNKSGPIFRGSRVEGDISVRVERYFDSAPFSAHQLQLIQFSANAFNIGVEDSLLPQFNKILVDHCFPTLISNVLAFIPEVNSPRSPVPVG